jgi:hypothetical protein
VTYPLSSSDSTWLRISGVGMSPYAARGLTQTLNPIDQSKDLRRTINGELVDFSIEQFRKYASVISGNDQMPPGVAGIWPGRDVQVECIAELYYVTAGGSAERPAADGSERVEGPYTYYRPVLNMRVVDINQSFDEWDAQVSWSLTLEEI